MSPTELVMTVLFLLVLLFWLPVVVWVTVQFGVYAFLMARRNFARRNKEKFDGSWQQEQEG